MTVPQPEDRLPPLSYNAGSARPKIVRPVSVGLLAFVGIVVGSSLLFCNAMVMAADAMMLAHPERNVVKEVKVPPLDPLIVKFGAANALAMVVFAAVLLGNCLAALNLRPIARKVILIWSIAFILLGIARTVGEINYVGPANLQWVAKNKPDEPTFASGQMAAKIVPNAIGLLVLYCVLPALFLMFWTRKDVKAAFVAARRIIAP